MSFPPERSNALRLVELALPKGPGQINASGIAGLLKGADENPWEVMLREAVQNSWDARMGDYIDFTLRGRRADPAFGRVLGDLLEGPQGRRLVQELGPRPFLVEVVDRKTTGLDGDVGYGESNTSSNFRRFVFETGRDSEQAKGGGSFGYGKAAFFSLSAVGTVVIYTRIKDREGELESRLVVVRVDHDQDPGRIWWGKGLTGEGVRWMDPLTGGQADQIADSLGLSAFSRNETGTNLLILAPRQIAGGVEGANTETEEMTFRSLADSVVRWFWPKFCTADREIRFLLSLGREIVPIPDPVVEPPWCHYVNALAAARGLKPTDANVAIIKSQRPRVTLGTAAWIEGDLPGPRSMAYMRDIGFVVFYRESPFEDDQSPARYGVFTTASGNAEERNGQGDRVNEAFRDSENQSHDEWNPHNCRDPWQQSVVRIALRLSWQFLANGNADTATRGAGFNLVRLRDELGGILFHDGYRTKQTGGPSRPVALANTTTNSFRKNTSQEVVYKNDDSGSRIGIPYEFTTIVPSQAVKFHLLPAVRREDGSVGVDGEAGFVRIIALARLESDGEVPFEDIERRPDGSLVANLSEPGQYLVYCRATKAVVLDVVVRILPDSYA